MRSMFWRYLLMPALAISAIGWISPAADYWPTEPPAATAPAPAEGTLPQGWELIDDMILPIAQRGTYAANLWPAGVIPYEFAANVNAANQQQAIDAMAEWEARSQVDFVPRDGQPDYVRIFDAPGNWSNIGMVGGQQEIGITSWENRFVIAHELAHTMGVWHEQSRPDRDLYIQVNYENIPPGTGLNFDIQQDAGTVGPYDFDSVMHYGQYAFSINGLPSITVLPPNDVFWQDAIGQRNHISDSDAATAAFLYGAVRPQEDCNANGVQDDFEIAESLASDCNSDGLPDICQFDFAAADFDGSGAVNLTDFELFSACQAGPGAAVAWACGITDVDSDEDADTADFAVFQRFFGEMCP